MQEKRCPICKYLKSVEEFDKYFSKERQKFRYQNYCKICSKSEKKRTSKQYYKNNTANRLKYAKTYRDKPEHKEKIKALSQKFKIKYREELKDCYVREQLVKYEKLEISDINANPELIIAKRTQLLIKRKIKQHGTEQNSRPE